MRKIKAIPTQHSQLIDGHGIERVLCGPADARASDQRDAGEGFEIAYTQRKWLGPTPEIFVCNVNAMKCDKAQ